MGLQAPRVQQAKLCEVHGAAAWIRPRARVRVRRCNAQVHEGQAPLRVLAEAAVVASQGPLLASVFALGSQLCAAAAGPEAAAKGPQDLPFQLLGSIPGGRLRLALAHDGGGGSMPPRGRRGGGGRGGQPEPGPEGGALPPHVLGLLTALSLTLGQALTSRLWATAAAAAVPGTSPATARAGIASWLLLAATTARRLPQSSARRVKKVPTAEAVATAPRPTATAADLRHVASAVCRALNTARIALLRACAAKFALGRQDTQTAVNQVLLDADAVEHVADEHAEELGHTASAAEEAGHERLWQQSQAASAAASASASACSAASAEEAEQEAALHLTQAASAASASSASACSAAAAQLAEQEASWHLSQAASAAAASSASACSAAAAEEAEQEASWHLSQAASAAAASASACSAASAQLAEQEASWHLSQAASAASASSASACSAAAAEEAEQEAALHLTQAASAASASSASACSAAAAQLAEQEASWHLSQAASAAAASASACSPAAAEEAEQHASWHLSQAASAAAASSANACSAASAEEAEQEASWHLSQAASAAAAASANACSAAAAEEAEQQACWHLSQAASAAAAASANACSAAAAEEAEQQACWHLSQAASAAAAASASACSPAAAEEAEQHASWHLSQAASAAAAASIIACSAASAEEAEQEASWHLSQGASEAEAPSGVPCSAEATEDLGQVASWHLSQAALIAASSPAKHSAEASVIAISAAGEVTEAGLSPPTEEPQHEGHRFFLLAAAAAVGGSASSSARLRLRVSADAPISGASSGVVALGSPLGSMPRQALEPAPSRLDSARSEEAHSMGVRRMGSLLPSPGVASAGVQTPRSRQLSRIPFPLGFGTPGAAAPSPRSTGRSAASRSVASRSVASMGPAKRQPAPKVAFGSRVETPRPAVLPTPSGPRLTAAALALAARTPNRLRGHQGSSALRSDRYRSLRSSMAESVASQSVTSERNTPGAAPTPRAGPGQRSNRAQQGRTSAAAPPQSGPSAALLRAASGASTTAAAAARAWLRQSDDRPLSKRGGVLALAEPTRAVPISPSAFAMPSPGACSRSPGSSAPNSASGPRWGISHAGGSCRQSTLCTSVTPAVCDDPLDCDLLLPVPVPQLLPTGPAVAGSRAASGARPRVSFAGPGVGQGARASAGTGGRPSVARAAHAEESGSSGDEGVTSAFAGAADLRDSISGLAVLRPSSRVGEDKDHSRSLNGSHVLPCAGGPLTASRRRHSVAAYLTAAAAAATSELSEQAARHRRASTLAVADLERLGSITSGGASCTASGGAAPDAERWSTGVRPMAAWGRVDGAGAPGAPCGSGSQTDKGRPSNVVEWEAPGREPERTSLELLTPPSPAQTLAAHPSALRRRSASAGRLAARSAGSDTPSSGASTPAITNCHPPTALSEGKPTAAAAAQPDHLPRLQLLHGHATLAVLAMENAPPPSPRSPCPRACAPAPWASDSTLAPDLSASPARQSEASLDLQPGASPLRPGSLAGTAGPMTLSGPLERRGPSPSSVAPLSPGGLPPQAPLTSSIQWRATFASVEGDNAPLIARHLGLRTGAAAALIPPESPTSPAVDVSVTARAPSTASEPCGVVPSSPQHPVAGAAVTRGATFGAAGPSRASASGSSAGGSPQARWSQPLGKRGPATRAQVAPGPCRSIVCEPSPMGAPGAAPQSKGSARALSYAGTPKSGLLASLTRRPSFGHTSVATGSLRKPSWRQVVDMPPGLLYQRYSEKHMEVTAASEAHSLQDPSQPDAQGSAGGAPVDGRGTTTPACAAPAMPVVDVMAGGEAAHAGQGVEFPSPAACLSPLPPLVECGASERGSPMTPSLPPAGALRDSRPSPAAALPGGPSGPIRSCCLTPRGSRSGAPQQPDAQSPGYARSSAAGSIGRSSVAGSVAGSVGLGAGEEGLVDGLGRSGRGLLGRAAHRVSKRMHELKTRVAGKGGVL
ncbi:hypothetical protein HYH03_004138 [Edaphochlamys debaryana]|uniref:Uncharacterized protein n=1 Tax=Edaphochlamys debaryana TaxID=47281 RepID=A0A835YAE1_9CHLO|nr:hypothetical protein HYH03_004138 [Edaphochlamys debaryana]|eukprot:KAG2497872.1 hypothetical protein HYH03_004138 [Edaphochlamys debaryana]